MSEADLEYANLSKSDLRMAFLPETKLCHANLSGANLYKANLKHANLRGYKEITAEGEERRFGALTTEVSQWRSYSYKDGYTDLKAAILEGIDLSGAIYDNGTIWPKGFDPIKAGAIPEPNYNVW